MKTQRLALALTVLNLILLNLILLIYIRPAFFSGIAPIVRARAFELVDDQGRLRAQLIVVPASTMDGKDYAESTLFRLIDINGRPSVKIGTSVDGSGMSLAGDSEHHEWNGIQLLAEATGSSVKLTNKDGSIKIVEP